MWEPLEKTRPARTARRVSALRQWVKGGAWGRERELSLTSLARTRSMELRFQATSLLFLWLSSAWKVFAAISTNLFRNEGKLRLGGNDQQRPLLPSPQRPPRLPVLAPEGPAHLAARSLYASVRLSGLLISSTAGQTATCCGWMRWLGRSFK